MIDDSNLMGKLSGFVEILRREEDRRALGHQVTDHLPHRESPARIKAGRRLIQEDDWGRHDQAGRQVETPAHASRVRLDEASGSFYEIKAFEQGACSSLCFCTWQVVELPDHLQVFVAGQSFIDGGVLTRQTNA